MHHIVLKMDKIIDSKFERLERALSTLIDSVAKFNPSAAQARDVDDADKELCKGLEEGMFYLPYRHFPGVNLRESSHL